MTAVRTTRRVLPALVVLIVALTGCTVRPAAPPDEPVRSAPVSAALPAVDCASSMKAGPLPPWARDGFRDDGASFRHVEGLRGVVVGVVFGYPLTSPRRPSRENKILWVARSPTSSRLIIDAQRDGTGPVVTREVGFGGGQSIVDLPTAGCWRMTLRWDDQVTDTVDVPYVAPR